MLRRRRKWKGITLIEKREEQKMRNILTNKPHVKRGPERKVTEENPCQNLRKPPSGTRGLRVRAGPEPRGHLTKERRARKKVVVSKKVSLINRGVKQCKVTKEFLRDNEHNAKNLMTYII